MVDALRFGALQATFLSVILACLARTTPSCSHRQGTSRFLFTTTLLPAFRFRIFHTSPLELPAI